MWRIVRREDFDGYLLTYKPTIGIAGTEAVCCSNESNIVKIFDDVHFWPKTDIACCILLQDTIAQRVAPALMNGR